MVKYFSKILVEYIYINMLNKHRFDFFSSGSHEAGPKWKPTRRNILIWG